MCCEIKICLTSNGAFILYLHMQEILSQFKTRRTLYFSLCVCFFDPLEKCSLLWRHHHRRRRAANFDLCSALMAIEHRGFFSVSHLLWHALFVYIGLLRGPVTLTFIAERLAVELSLPIYTCRDWGFND